MSSQTLLRWQKALGGGVPIGATLYGEKVAETMGLGSHGSTYGGNPIMCAVALASLKKIANPALLERVNTMGEKLRAELHAINGEFGIFKEVRGRGLMIGAELVESHAGKASDISEAARKAGVLVLVAGPNVSRFLPPLTITDDELKEGMLRFRNGLAAYLEK
jgi:acetylornithine/N-succinyldiaminopimelate aminotransferase